MIADRKYQFVFIFTPAPIKGATGSNRLPNRHHLTRACPARSSLAVAYAPWGVRVNAIAPSATMTSGSESSSPETPGVDLLHALLDLGVVGGARSRSKSQQQPRRPAWTSI